MPTRGGKWKGTTARTSGRPATCGGYEEVTVRKYLYQKFIVYATRFLGCALEDSFSFVSCWMVKLPSMQNSHTVSNPLKILTPHVGGMLGHPQQEVEWNCLVFFREKNSRKYGSKPLSFALFKFQSFLDFSCFTTDCGGPIADFKHLF